MKTGTRLIPCIRQPVDFIRGAVAEHAQQGGQVLWAWNLLHDHLFALLVVVLSEGNYGRAHDVANAIWNELPSDSTQRKVLLSVAQAVYSQRTRDDGKPSRYEDRRALVGVVWLVAQVDALAKHRNDIAHAPIHFALMNDNSVRPIAVSASGKKSRVDRLEERPIAEIWEDLHGDLIALASYAFTLRAALHHLARRCPLRPELKMLPRPKRKPKKRSPQSKPDALP